VWWCAIRRLTPVLFVVLFVFSVLPTSGKGSQAGSAPRPTRQIPFVKVDPADLDRLPDGERIRERHVARQATSAQRWSTIHQLLGPRQVSRKSHALLRQRGLGPALLTKSAPVPGLVAAATPDDPDTLKVLLVRIGFESDVSGDLTSVTTDGDFRLEADPAIRIDPPPHNRAFYESHLNGLSEFYHYQSGGRLEIEYRVLPEAANECYKLSDIADYGPGEDGFWSIDSLGQLVVDMITTTDEQTQADGSVSLADYDDDDPFTYVIFVHAGSDWQSDVNQDSPNDIPTFFVTLGDTIAPDLTSIDSDTGTPGFLSECSVIPETTSQDGYTNDEGEYVPYVGSIAAALYHEFGHALGLVDLYNTATGLPTVGIWDLMDSGTNLSVVVGFEIPDTDPVEYDIIPVVGLLPPSLGAWDKWFLGWVKLADVDNRDALYQLPAVQVMREEYDLFDGVAGDFFSADPQVLVAGASPDEFFLIENRWVPPDPSATPFGELVFEADDSTGVVMYLAGELDGDYRNSGLYDYFLPAGGLLVWHVNMDRVNANLEYNLVNAWGDGVRLVEADGLQDVGVLDAYVLGWYGSERDPFSADFGYDELFTDGFPNSRAYDRSWTGISLRGISATGGVMSFSAGIEPLLPGWPFQVASVDAAEAAVAGGQATARAIDPASLTVFPTGSSETLVFADGPGVDWTGDLYPAKLFALDVAGDSRFPAVADLPTGAFAALTAPLAGPPAVVTMENDVETLVLGAQDGWLHSYFYDTTSETMALLWSTSVGDSLAFAPQIGTDSDGSYYLLCAVPPRSVAVYDEDGQPVGAPLALINDTGGAIAGFVAPPTRIERANAGDRWAVFSPGGWTLVDVTAGGPVATYDLHTHDAGVDGPLRRAVLTGTDDAPLADDAALLLVFDSGGLRGSWHIGDNGDATAHAWRGTVADSLVAEPAVADLDGDGGNDVVLVTGEKLMAFTAGGVALTGFPCDIHEFFPLPDSTSIAGPIVVFDADGNGQNEIFFNTDAGHLMATDARGRLLDGTPFKWGDSVGQAGLLVGPGRADQEERALWLATEGGYRGPPLERTFYNGRLSCYGLPTTASAAVQTSEWLGAGGGSRRLGPEGTPHDLGIWAPRAPFLDRVVFYPNPLSGSRVTVRFHSATDRDARLAVFNLEGEEITRLALPTRSDEIVEHDIDLSELRSGLYICQFQRETDEGLETTTTTLAVER